MAGRDLAGLLDASEHRAVVGRHQALSGQVIELGEVTGVELFPRPHAGHRQREIPAFLGARRAALTRRTPEREQDQTRPERRDTTQLTERHGS